MIHFTYLDLIDPTISFVPVMATNWFKRQGISYSLFTEDETKRYPIPGYEGKRCILDIDMARALSQIQKQLMPQGLSLRIYDAYRPQQAVDFFTTWTEMPDTPLAKANHYPALEKKDFHDLSYLSRTSSHTLGTAVDVTIIRSHPNPSYPKENPSLLGMWDPESLDMGPVGYLAFDERSWHDFKDVTPTQKANRTLLKTLMLDHGFDPLATEFWHYYFAPHRNPNAFFAFPIRDTYPVGADKIIQRDYQGLVP